MTIVLLCFYKKLEKYLSVQFKRFLRIPMPGFSRTQINVGFPAPDPSICEEIHNISINQYLYPTSNL